MLSEIMQTCNQIRFNFDDKFHYAETLFQAALKIYFNSDTKNFTELEMIDTQLYAQGIRYPVYQWFDGIGKAELFFDGLSDEQVIYTMVA